jgi:hypothetical protein
MKLSKWLSGILVLGLVGAASGCGGGSSNSTASNAQAGSGSVFVNGTDAPLASVIGFTVDITSITATNQSSNDPVTISNGVPGVDFARLNGLRSLLDMNLIPPGTYDTITVALANPQISYLNVTNPQTVPPTPPTVTTLNGTSTPPAAFVPGTSTVTINLANPLTITSTGEVIGLLVDFDLRKSIQVDSNGNFTGMVNPALSLEVVTPSDADAYIDDFVAGVVTPNASSTSFTIQGPHGHQFTVNVGAQTEWENGEGQSNLTSTSIVELSGTLDKTANTIDADTVAILSQDAFYAGGLITFVNPATGAANDFDLYVRSTLPAGTGFQSENISQIDLHGSEKYFIYWWHLKFASFLFNSSLLVPGQHVSIGGPFSNGAVTVQRVVLRHEGHNGALVTGMTDVGAGTFEFNSNGLAGVLFNGPITVYCTPFTVFKGGLTGLSSLTGGTALNLRVVGLVLKDPISSQPVFVAHSVEQLTN